VGEACGAIASNADACTIANKGDKSVQLTTVADQSALMMTVIAPGETIKQDKSLCEKFTRGEAHYDARYAALRAMPDAPDFTLKTAAAGKPVPKPKPAPAMAAAAPEPTLTTAPTPQPVAVAAGPPVPRAKPALQPLYPPSPRAKPAAPIETAAVRPAPSAAPPSPPVAAVAPTAAVAPAASPTDCGEACATILFKVVDNCLWVVNPNPRTVAFEVEAGGRRVALTLEAADGEKADARAAALAKGQPVKDEAALHMRVHDPFQSAGSGIPIYRARLGSAQACVHERKDVTRFSARFVN
jgi:hypothetical protein